MAENLQPYHSVLARLASLPASDGLKKTPAILGLTGVRYQLRVRKRCLGVLGVYVPTIPFFFAVAAKDWDSTSVCGSLTTNRTSAIN
jgi:hypothetical protein